MIDLATRLAVAILLATSACKGSASSSADPKYEVALPGADDVDDSLSTKIPGERMPATYAAEDPIKGAKAPLVTIVEFSDFQCPFCGQTASVLDEVAAAYPDDVRLVFKHFPLKMHPDATEGAKAAAAAGRQDRFWAMHDRLFANRTKMSRDDVVGHAKAIGLDVQAFETALDDGSTAARVAADKRAGAVIGVQGTPSFFVNGRAFSGAVAGDALAAVVDEERAAGQRLVDAGSTRAAVYGRIMRAASTAARAP